MFYDFTFSPAKSVSIAALVGNDQRIMEAHDEAVRWPCVNWKSTQPVGFGNRMRHAYRLTGNLVGAVFRHDTSRALDPHLHTHCILFNATRDSVEGSWKALEICEMLMAKKFRLMFITTNWSSADSFWLRLENNPRGDFEIRGRL